MRRIKAFFRRHELSLKGKIIRNLALIALLLGVIFIASGSSGVTERQRLRTAERARMVGPGEILANVPMQELSYPAVYVIDEGTGLAIYTTDDRQSSNSWENRFIYMPGTGDVTLVAAPEKYFPSDQTRLIVFALDKFPGAARAELRFQVEDEVSYDVPFAETYTVASDREYEGFFVFEIEGKYTSLPSTDAWRSQETYNFHRVGGGSSADGFPATVRFFDDAGALIAEVETILAGSMFFW